MKKIRSIATLLSAVALCSPLLASAHDHCNREPTITFIEMQTPNLVLNTSGQVVVNGNLTLKGKLKIPNSCDERHTHGGKPAVLVLHGSSGVDLRGDFYAEALNNVGIATLEIDLWEARGVGVTTTRPALPALTYGDAFTALRFLSNTKGINPSRIGVLGFSWGGVLSMASATQNVATSMGGNLRFKAHAANYPVCFAYNNSAIPNSAFGSPAGNPLTGAPIMIQIGSNDDYDRANAAGDGTGKCLALRDSLPAAERSIVSVVRYEGAYHGWDRLMVPTKVYDPFGHLGADRYDTYARVELRPDAQKAYQSMDRVVKFFNRNL